MHRRNIIGATLAAVGSALALSGKKAQAHTLDNQKVVYHLADLDKVGFVLGNIRHHFDGVGGPKNITIALVVHGPALKAFQSTQANPDMTKRVGEFSKAGLEMHACGNTMKGMNVTLKDLLPGFVNADRGGVVRIAELQQQGYLYLRP